MRSRVQVVWMVIWPGFTLLTAFLPWFQMVVPKPGVMFNVVTLSPAAWGWIVVNIAALGLWRWGRRGRVLWSLLGSAAFGGGIATGFSLGTAARVSQLLSAPVPLRPLWGFDLFIGGSLGWAAFGWLWLFRLQSQQENRGAMENSL